MPILLGSLNKPLERAPKDGLENGIACYVKMFGCRRKSRKIIVSAESALFYDSQTWISRKP